jgi:predicted nucleic acid-binding protein
VNVAELKKIMAIKTSETGHSVLVDTCAWIEFLREKTSPLGDQVAALIAQDRAVLCGVVVAELRQGLKLTDGQRHKVEVAKLQKIFDLLPCLATEEEDWHAAGQSLQQLRSQGITVPLTDALIATIAKRCQVQVLTLDAHFKALGFEVFV